MTAAQAGLIVGASALSALLSLAVVRFRDRRPVRVVHYTDGFRVVCPDLERPVEVPVGGLPVCSVPGHEQMPVQVVHDVRLLPGGGLLERAPAQVAWPLGHPDLISAYQDACAAVEAARRVLDDALLAQHAAHERLWATRPRPATDGGQRWVMGQDGEDAACGCGRAKPCRHCPDGGEAGGRP